MCAEILQRTADRIFDSLIARAICIYDKCLADYKASPDIIANTLFLFARADPAVLTLTFKNSVNIFFGTGLHVVIVKKVSKRHKAVEPIRDSLPTLVISSYPA